MVSWRIRVCRGGAGIRNQRLKRKLLIRWDAGFPTLYQIRARGLLVSPIAYGTAHVASLFIKHFPKELAGVFPPEALPAKNSAGDSRRCPFAGYSREHEK